MKKIMMIVFLVSLFCISLNATAMDYLSPCTDYIDARKLAVIKRAAPEPYILAAEISPSFSSDRTIRLIKRGGRYHLITLIFDDTLWDENRVINNSGVKERTAPPNWLSHNVHSIPISTELYTALVSIWDKTISAKKEYGNSGHDGVNYRFILSGSKCGMVWSPQEGSYIAGMVEVLDMLLEHTKLVEKTRTYDEEQRVVGKLIALEKYW